ncbi:MAG: hypothetical protein MZV63_66250 [Marinilabiliales bacterium]|nr:hypothetical protein [Marinilabiliales bacterium]
MGGPAPGHRPGRIQVLGDRRRPRRPAVVGDYSYRARWEGRLEPDGDDFLLVHLKTEVLEWRLGEKAGPPGRGVPARGAPRVRAGAAPRSMFSREGTIARVQRRPGRLHRPAAPRPSRQGLSPPAAVRVPDRRLRRRPLRRFPDRGIEPHRPAGYGPRPAQARPVLLVEVGAGSWGPRPGPASPTGPASATRTRSRPSSPWPPADPRAVRPADGTCRRRGGAAPG